MVETKIVPIPLRHDPSHHAYLIMVPGDNILIDPGGYDSAEKLRGAIEQYLPIHRVNGVILQCTHCSNTAALHYLKEWGLDATVYYNSSENLDLNVMFDAKPLSELHYELTLKNEEILTFIPAPFLPYPDAFMTFYSGRNALFSSNVFSQMEDTYDSLDQLKGALQAYHERTMPSSEFLRPVLKKLLDLPLRSIYPLIGAPIKGDWVRASLNYLIKADFYNTNLVSINRDTGKRRYNYPMILNHMLKKLESLYNPLEISNVFKDSPIRLEHNTSLEIKEGSLTGYKLYNRFFEDIFRDKGEAWLSLLEPLVRKYTKMYGIKKPTIYESQMYKTKREIESLHKEKSNLEKQVDALNESLSKTTEALIRCPITGLYNARFFQKHMQQVLKDTSKPKNDHAFLAIQIDRFKDLNLKHGKVTGDETLQNAAYLIDTIKPDEALLFRKEGPGFYLYVSKASKDDLKRLAVKIRNGIHDSSLFNETISVSIAIVTADEIEYDHPEALSEALCVLASKRIERAQRAGKGQILDADADTSRTKEGTILIVDEDETVHNLMVQIFSRIQFDVVIAKDIYEGFSLVQNSDIDVIISEINLSKLDGLQFKQWLNDTQSFKDIPFIIATHHKNREVIKRANLLRVDLVLKKPLIPEELIGHVERMRERGRKV